MIIFDTDVLSLLDAKGGHESAHLLQQMNRHETEVISVTVISLEEQLRGWLSYIAASRQTRRQIEGYARLHALFRAYRDTPLIDFDVSALEKFESLRHIVRIGTMDLKIASICLVHDALLISRNLRDFRKVPRLRVEDWTE